MLSSHHFVFQVTLDHQVRTEIRSLNLQSNEDVSLSDDRKIMKGLHQSRIYPGQFPGHHTKELNELSCKEVENNEMMNTNDNLPIGTGGKKVRSGGKTVSHFSTTPK